jgi:hypothetical protein
MKIIAAVATAAAAIVVASAGALAAPLAPPQIASTTCVTVGATWVDTYQVTPRITVCLPTP